VWNKTVKAFIVIIGGVLAVYSLFYFCREVNKIVNWKNAGYFQSHFRFPSDTKTIISFAAPEDFPEGPVPANGDTIVSINGERPAYELFRRMLGNAPGVPVGNRHSGSVTADAANAAAIGC
jgi:hypothetical protein